MAESHPWRTTLIATGLFFVVAIIVFLLIFYWDELKSLVSGTVSAPVSASGGGDGDAPPVTEAADIIKTTVEDPIAAGNPSAYIATTSVWPARNVLDGDDNTYWNPPYNDPTGYALVFKFDQEYTFTGMKARTTGEAIFEAVAIKVYLADGTKVGDFTAKTVGTYMFDEPFVADEVKVVFVPANRYQVRVNTVEFL